MKAFSQRRRKVNLYQLVVWPEDAGYLKYIGWSNPIQSNPLNMLITERFTNCFEIGQNWFQIDTGCNVTFLIDFSWWAIMKTFSQKTIRLMEVCCTRLFWHLFLTLIWARRSQSQMWFNIHSLSSFKVTEKHRWAGTDLLKPTFTAIVQTALFLVTYGQQQPTAIVSSLVNDTICTPTAFCARKGQCGWKN